jgi:hypothetical protein
MSVSSMWGAVTSSVSKLVSGTQLPFEQGEEITSFAGKTPWRMYSGKKDGEVRGQPLERSRRRSACSIP